MLTWELLMRILFLVCSVVHLIIPLVIKSIRASCIICAFIALAFLLLGFKVVFVGWCVMVFVKFLGYDVGFVILISMSPLPSTRSSIFLIIILLISTLSLKRLLFPLLYLWSYHLWWFSLLAHICLLVMTFVRRKCIIK